MIPVERLVRERGLMVECPNCSEVSPMRSFRPFDATAKLPAHATEFITQQHAQLKEERTELRRRRVSVRERSRRAAESTNIGKVVEKIAPALAGFPVAPADCRAIFEPIDYVVFHGLARQGRVEAVTFADVKSGGAGLKPVQRQIRSLVEGGKVSLHVGGPDAGAIH